MGFGFMPGRPGYKFDRTTLWAVLFTIAFFALMIYMYVAINKGVAKAYRELHGNQAKDQAAIAASIKATIYDGGDAKRTAHLGLLLSATETPLRGVLIGADEAVNYLYYARGKRTIEVTVKATGTTNPVVTLIGPAGKVLTRNDNPGSLPEITVRTDLPETEGYYTIRMSANTLDPAQNSGAYTLAFSTPFYWSPWEWEQLLAIVPFIVLVLFGVVALMGKLFNIPVGALLNNLRNLFRGTCGLEDPLDSIRNHPSRHMIVQYPHPRRDYKRQPVQGGEEKKSNDTGLREDDRRDVNKEP